jgi:hypothetical protein
VVHSRTGFLPTVRGTQARYPPTILTRERVEAHVAQHGCVRLEEFVAWTRQEMAAAGEVAADLDLNNLQPPTDIAQFLEREIELAARPRVWQAVLYSTNNVIDLVWSAMPDADRAQFWPHVSAWMAYRVSIPVEHYGAVVVATGTPRDARQLDSDLIQNILAYGLGRAHPYGGLIIDPASGSLVNSAGRKDPRITALGELTSGTFFFTSVLEIIARHAQNRAAIVLEELELPHSQRRNTEAVRLSA